jgi:hypothetical protein
MCTTTRQPVEDYIQQKQEEYERQQHVTSANAITALTGSDKQEESTTTDILHTL